MLSTKPHTSAVRITDDWYVLCRSNDLTTRPLSFTLCGVPLVLFRGASGRPGVLIDRCPHRNVPLSLGSVDRDAIQCAYHGWKFDMEGRCRFVAGVPEEEITEACHVTAYPVREQQGFVWVYASAGAPPGRDPYRFPLMDDPSYTTDATELRAEGTIHAVAENALDVPHTAYLHGGLFRSKGGRNRSLEVEVRIFSNKVEAEYFGEPAPSGLAGRLLAPGGGTVVHVDRFILPSITQVDYRLGEKTHISVTVAMTPAEDLLTRLFAVVSFRSPFPGWTVKPILRPLFLKIFRQDADMLRAQRMNVARFGGAQFASIGADLLGPAILRLMKEAEGGRRPSEDQPIKTRKEQLLI